MDNPNDPFLWLIAEALQQLGSKADPKAIADRVRRLQRGLPAEDEFSMLLTWLGRCRLVHKLDQLQSPLGSRKTWRAPDLFAVFDYHGREVPVLIEVKTTPFTNNTLSWQPAYRDTLLRYADMVKLPLLVAWRFGTFWTLVDVQQLKAAPTRYRINFLDAMKSSLMTELAGDFSFSLREGCGMHLKIRKHRETKDGFVGQIEEAYWQNAEGQKFKNAPGVFPLFTCIEQESIQAHEGDYLTQSFVISDSRMAQLASRALGTLLHLSMGDDEARWRRALEQSRSAPFAPDGLRKAADQALESGFLRYAFNIQPDVLPDFLSTLHPNHPLE